MNRKSKLAAIAGEYANELQQLKKAKAGSVSMLLLPLTEKDSTAKSHIYNIRITLRANQPVKNTAAMQYMNFDIKNSFLTIQGADTIPCAICERIPGISNNEFLYITRFNKTQHGANENKDLRLLITDTVAGFGETVFCIKSDALKMLEQ